MANETSDVKFLHGLKANIPSAIEQGKIDKDDFIIAADTDDELIFINHENKVKPIKSRTSQEFTLNGTSIGALEDGATIPAGTSIDDLLKLIVAKQIHPTYTAPSVGLTTSIKTYNQEVGTTITPTFTATFTQNDAGKINSIAINHGSTEIEAGEESPLAKAYEFTVAAGDNKFTAVVDYAAGSIKKDNLGQDDATGAIAADTKTSAAVTYVGKYNAFYGTKSGSIDPEVITSDEIRALGRNILGAVKGTTFTINVPVGAKTIAFAYPASVQDVAKVEYVETNDGAMADNFEKNTVDVALPDGTIVDYKLYTYEMAVAAAATMTIKVTI